jgi:hypothetical protein
MVARAERCFGFSHAQAEAWVNVNPCDAWGSALDAKTMAFEGTNADACVVALNALSCGVTRAPAACDGVIRGLVPIYGGLGTPGACSPGRQLSTAGDMVPSLSSNVPAPFALFSECVSGAFCARHTMTASGPLFTCQAFPQLGEACTSVGCATGVCDHSKHCAAPKQVDEACSDDADCDLALYCDTSSRCAAKHPTGPCSSATECLAPAICKSGMCTVPQVGDPCTPACSLTSTSPTGCLRGQYCGADATCHRAPIAGEGCYVALPNPSEWILCLVGACSTANLCELGRCTDAPIGASCGANQFCDTQDAFKCKRAF